MEKSISQMKFAILLMSALMFFCNVNAQVAASQLVGTKWEMIGEKGDETIATWSFSKSEITKDVLFKPNGKNYRNKLKYYISKNIPSAFNSDLVGKGTSGKYLVVYNHKIQRYDWYIIQSIDQSTGDMYLVRERKEGEIGNKNLITTYHFKRISSHTREVR